MYSETTGRITPTSGRRRRSVLFVPGSNERAIDKARNSEADCIVLDLEDMVSHEAKPAAREIVAMQVGAGGFGGREIIVRFNSLDTEWGRDDIIAVAALPVDALLVPMISTAAEIGAYLDLIDTNGGRECPLWMLAETPQAIIDLDAIAGCSPRLAAIVMGTQDLIKALGIRPEPSRLGLAPMLSHAVVCARAHGLSVIDGVYTALNDDEGFAAICAQGTAFGFDGKALIHPSQIAIANQSFG